VVEKMDSKIKELQGFKVSTIDFFIDEYYKEDELISIIRAGEVTN
jgi:hypothetical protein